MSYSKPWEGFAFILAFGGLAMLGFILLSAYPQALFFYLTYEVLGVTEETKMTIYVIGTVLLVGVPNIVWGFYWLSQYRARRSRHEVLLLDDELSDHD